MRRLLAFAITLLILTGSAWANAEQRRVDATAITEWPLSLTEYLSVLEDPGGKLTISDVRQSALAARFTGGHSPAEALALGFTESAVWLRLVLRNDTSEVVQRILEIAIARHSSVQFYFPVVSDDGTRYELIDTGYARSFADRPYKHRFFVFPFVIPEKSEQTVFLRFQGPDGMDIPARLWAPSAFHQHERDDYMVQAVYLGMVLSMVAFNLLLSFALRDINYLLYVAFVSFVALNVVAANGLGFQYLWGNSPQIAMKGTLIFSAAGLASLTLFARRMLDTRKHTPRIDVWLKVFVATQVIAMAGLWFAFSEFLQPALLSAVPGVGLILLSALFVARHNRRSATLFIAAFGVICIAGVVAVMRSFAILPTTFLTSNGIQIGSAIEMILLAFALADRYNQLRHEKESAQHAALTAKTEALRAEQKVVETLRESERLLEGRVAQRTADLSSTIEQLKQTQAELVQAEKLASLGSLVAGVAHELNTPLGNALTTSSALDYATAEFRRVVESGEVRRSTFNRYAEAAGEMSALILKSCQRAATLVSSFKQVAVDQTTEQRRQFDLSTLINDNVAALRPGFRHLPWQIVNDVKPGLTCDGYPGALGQVIACLVQNAVAHAFEGRESGTLRISAELDKTSVKLIAIDDGKGMSPQVLSHIF